MTSRLHYVILGRRSFRSPDGRSVRGAFDSRTASLFALPEELAQVLEDPRKELTRAQEAALSRADLLADPAAGASYLSDLESASSDLTVRTFILMPTPACNMGCHYCGQTHSGRSLKARYADLVVPRISAAIAEPVTRVVNVNWFGGEPLLAQQEIFAISAILIPKARKHNVTYQSQLTTNGSLFTTSLLRELTTAAGVTRIDVTVDGPKAIHDASRKMKNGSSTYDRILTGVKSALGQPWAADCEFVIRTNVTMESLPHVTEYLQDLAARGLTGPNGPSLQIAPVHKWGVGTDAYELSVAAFAAAEIGWFNLAVDLDLNFWPLPGLAAEPCSAGQRGAETIDPQGLVYDCPELPLRQSGPVFVPLSRRPAEPAGARPIGALMSDMTWSTAIGTPPCRSCSLLPVCGGACALSRATGQAECPSMKHNFRERIDVALRRAFASPGKVS